MGTPNSSDSLLDRLSSVANSFGAVRQDLAGLVKETANLEKAERDERIRILTEAVGTLKPQLVYVSVCDPLSRNRKEDIGVKICVDLYLSHDGLFFQFDIGYESPKLRTIPEIADARPIDQILVSLTIGINERLALMTERKLKLEARRDVLASRVAALKAIK